jgi:hypothetical protein
MQAAGLVGTIRPLGANGTEVSFINQPDLNAAQVGARHDTADELFQQTVHRLLVGNIQEQLGGEIRIVSAVSI